MSINTGGAIGPKRASALLAMIEAYLSTPNDDRQDLDAVAGDDTNRILHPGLSGQELHATDDDLQAMVDAGFIDVRTIEAGRNRRMPTIEAGNKRIRILEAALRAHQPEPERRIGFDTP